MASIILLLPDPLFPIKAVRGVNFIVLLSWTALKFCKRKEIKGSRMDRASTH